MPSLASTKLPHSFLDIKNFFRNFSELFINKPSVCLVKRPKSQVLGEISISRLE